MVLALTSCLRSHRGPPSFPLVLECELETNICSQYPLSSYFRNKSPEVCLGGSLASQNKSDISQQLGEAM